MTRRVTDIVNEGEALGKVGGIAASVPVVQDADEVPYTPTGELAATNVQAALDELEAEKAGDSAVVKLTGNQTVAGAKTFSTSPIVPTPTTDFQAATKKYVDDNSGGGGGSSGLLAVHSYNPSSQVEAQTTSTSFVDVDATNATITFTVPSSGNVIVDVVGNVYVPAGLGIDWGLRSGSSDVSGTNRRVMQGSSGDRSGTANLRVLLTGLTPSASVTYKLAHRVGVGSGTVTTRIGGTTAGTAGALVFAVTAAP